MPLHVIDCGHQTLSGNVTIIGDLSSTGILYGDGSGLTNVAGGGGGGGVSFVTLTPSAYATLVSTGSADAGTIYIVQE